MLPKSLLGKKSKFDKKNFPLVNLVNETTYGDSESPISSKISYSDLLYYHGRKVLVPLYDMIARAITTVFTYIQTYYYVFRRV